MPNTSVKKLFKVAREFNVSTQSIVDELAKHDMEVANKPNSKIMPDMYEVLEKVYGIDKERNIRHQQERDEYNKQRETMRSSRNESVTVDSLEPLEDTLGLEPQEDDKPKPDTFEAVLEPLEVEAEQPKSSAVEEPLEPQPTAEVSPEETPQGEETVEAEATVDQTAVEPDQSNPEHVELSSDEPAAVEEESTVGEAPTIEHEDSIESSNSDSEATTEVTLPDSNDYEQEQTSEAQAEIEPQAQKSQSEAEASQEVGQEQEVAKPEKPKRQPERMKAEEGGVIRGRADKLSGPKLMGTIKLTTDEKPEAAPKKRKKRKRKNAAEGTTADPATEVKAAAPKTEEKASAKKRKKKKGSREISTEDVDSKMRETMQKMQGGSTGKKRQKRRRDRREERQLEEMIQEEQRLAEQTTLEVTEFMTASDLADLLSVNVNEIIMKCMSIGMMVTLNQRLDANTIELIATEYDREVKFIDATEILESDIEEITDSEEELEPRAPIVTVMGHVDHGKTSLLDYIRKAKVAAGEAGGITQHIGAYQVQVNDEKQITFLDTPGHEAFTAMRSRGAQVTDVVILVVAADDSVMPQTKEAINHAKAAGVPIVVAMNKIDKPEANPDRIMSQLSEEDVIVEDWGGTNQCARVSAKTGEGIDELLEKVLIEAELLDLKANPERRAEGIVLESRLDKGKGVVANILVQKGKLKIGDPIVAGACFGKVRAMSNDKGQREDFAGPSYPVELLGFQEIPQAGDRLIVPKDEKTAREIANQRQQIKREQDIRRSSKHLSLDEISKRMAAGELNELNVILKADVDGSIEAISGSLQKLGNEEVSVNIIHTGAGAISESDVLLASASDAIIIGFQVRPTTNARKLAEKEQIDIRLYSVIYHAIEEVTATLEGMLSPEVKEVIDGVIDVRETFKVPNLGTIAGCYVTEGKVDRNSRVRLVRDGIVIYEGEMTSLKRFKDDVKEVKAGFECGLGIKNFNDIKVGDNIEAFSTVEEKRTFE